MPMLVVERKGDIETEGVGGLFDTSEEREVQIEEFGVKGADMEN